MRGRSLGIPLSCLIGLLGLLPWMSSSRVNRTPQGQSHAGYTVVINEIAWGGTAGSAADEWIELYNTTGMTVALEGWRLRAVDGSPDLALSGEIAPYSPYLIERTNDSTVSDIPADLVCPFGYGLSNTGESLQLVDASGLIVDTANGDGGPWPNGNDGGAPGYHSLERRTPWSPDADENWLSNDGTVTNGLDCNGNPINGTPRAMNASYLPIYNQHPDLAVEKRGASTAIAGSELHYTLTVRNLGGLTAFDTRVTDTLPGEAPLVWSLGDLPSGAVHRIDLTTRLREGAAVASAFENHVTVTTSSAEAITANNSARWTTIITTPVPTGQPEILISSVLYDGYQLNDEDEAVELINIGTTTGTLEGWSLCKAAPDGVVCRPLPTVTLPVGARIWIARNATAFARSFGQAPDYQAQSWLRLANTGDALLLRTSAGSFVDTLVYGDGSAPVTGWAGPAVYAYVNSLIGETGQLLSRKRDEQSGLPLTDTNTEADWVQSRADPATGRRAVYPGWNLDALSVPLQVTETATVVVGIAPDNAFDVVSATLLEARRAISIEVYSLRHPALIDLLVRKAGAGVKVTVLLEGNPVGVGVQTPEWQTQLFACQSLEAAGGACWFMAHEPTDRLYNRYRFMHAKMVIVDDTWVVLGSQNLTQGGLPSDDKSNGTLGSRGVVVATNAPALVQRATQIFALDCNPAQPAPDLVRWNTAYPERYGAPLADLVDLTPIDGISYTVAFPRPLIVNGTFGFELITAPESALRQSDGLLNLISRAGVGATILVQQLYEQSAWGASPEADPNLRLQAYIAAARRGARVRILVNGRSFAGDGEGVAADGLDTVAYVNTLAREEKLDLRAAVGDPAGEGIHNKMVLVSLQDVGHFAHIGSINGSEASSKINREVALQIRSAAVFDYLERLFQRDWWLEHPVLLPTITRNYVPPPPPAPHVVISEVAYTGLAAQEWVELTNPTATVVDLSAYKLGDAESRESWEPMFAFPPGTLLGPHAVLVIAVNANRVPEAHLEFYNTDDAIPDMIAYAGWGHSGYPFSLRNAGDQVILLGPDDSPVDVVIWGDASFPGVTPHPGVAVIGASLERYPPHRDTDNCALDFRERMPPTPGALPAPLGVRQSSAGCY